jgi:dTDP-4-dehydrorhamnose 3,5-epimerase
MTAATPPPRASSAIDGVRYGRITRVGDARGSFCELWRASAAGDIDPAAAGVGADASPVYRQINLSTSAAGVLRGLHLHRRQLDHWIVAGGRAFVALVDVRPLLRDAGAAPIVETSTLAADATIDIPVGVAHGFLALEPLDLVYLVTTEYDGTDELGFAWDDPLAAVDWPHLTATPDGRPILSDRDRSNPSLPELAERLRREG